MHSYQLRKKFYWISPQSYCCVFQNLPLKFFDEDILFILNIFLPKTKLFIFSPNSFLLL